MIRTVSRIINKSMFQASLIGRLLANFNKHYAGFMHGYYTLTLHQNPDSNSKPDFITLIRGNEARVFVEIKSGKLKDVADYLED